MKKNLLFIAVLAIVGLSFSSCNKNEDACWEITTEATIKGEKHTIVEYSYTTEAIVDAEMAKVKADFYADKDNKGTKNKIELKKKKMQLGKTDCQEENYKN